MKESDYISSHAETQQYDQSQLLNSQSWIISQYNFDKSPKIHNFTLSVNRKQQKTLSQWKTMLYILSFITLLGVLIFQFNIQIIFTYNRQQKFMSSMDQLKPKQINNIFNIPNENSNNIEQYQINLEQSHKQISLIANQNSNSNDNAKESRNTQNKLKQINQVSFSSSISAELPQNNQILPLTPSPLTNVLRKSQQAKPQILNNPPSPSLLIPQRSILLQKQTFERQVPKLFNPSGINTEQKLNSKKWRNLVFQDYTIDTELAKSQRLYYEEKYNILQYSQIPFCIVVPTFNNTNNNRYLNNIRSVVMQEYKNFHIVIIDDASTDNTGQNIQNFLKNQTKIPSEKYLMIRNIEQMNAMHNLRRAAMEFCKPQQIFLVVDGDDQLLGRQVLRFYNALFQKNKVWFIYSNYLGSDGGTGFSSPFPNQVIRDNYFRSYPFTTSHLRAFYTQLFRNILEQDLRDKNGQYFRAANDVAICIPILQQAHQRILYLPQITYYYNSNTRLYSRKQIISKSDQGQSIKLWQIQSLLIDIQNILKKFARFQIHTIMRDRDNSMEDFANQIKLFKHKQQDIGDLEFQQYKY